MGHPWRATHSHTLYEYFAPFHTLPTARYEQYVVSYVSCLSVIFKTHFGLSNILFYYFDLFLFSRPANYLIFNLNKKNYLPLAQLGDQFLCLFRGLLLRELWLRGRLRHNQAAGKKKTNVCYRSTHCRPKIESY